MTDGLSDGDYFAPRRSGRPRCLPRDRQCDWPTAGDEGASIALLASDTERLAHLAEELETAGLPSDATGRGISSSLQGAFEAPCSARPACSAPIFSIAKDRISSTLCF